MIFVSSFNAVVLNLCGTEGFALQRTSDSIWRDFWLSQLWRQGMLLASSE